MLPQTLDRGDDYSRLNDELAPWRRCEGGAMDSNIVGPALLVANPNTLSIQVASSSPNLTGAVNMSNAGLGSIQWTAQADPSGLIILAKSSGIFKFSDSIPYQINTVGRSAGTNYSGWIDVNAGAAGSQR